MTVEEVLERIDQLLFVLGMVSEDLSEVSRTLKHIFLQKQINEMPKQNEKIDKEQMLREIMRGIFHYNILGFKEFVISLKDQEVNRFVEQKEWNKLWDYLYAERYSDLLLLYKKAQAALRAYASYEDYYYEEEKGLYDDLPDGYEEIEYPQDDQTMYDY